jgi:hypothetical protein
MRKKNIFGTQYRSFLFLLLISFLILGLTACADSDSASGNVPTDDGYGIEKISPLPDGTVDSVTPVFSWSWDEEASADADGDWCYTVAIRRTVDESPPSLLYSVEKGTTSFDLANIPANSKKLMGTITDLSDEIITTWYWGVSAVDQPYDVTSNMDIINKFLVTPYDVIDQSGTTPFEIVLP